MKSSNKAMENAQIDYLCHKLHNKQECTETPTMLGWISKETPCQSLTLFSDISMRGKQILRVVSWSEASLYGCLDRQCSTSEMSNAGVQTSQGKYFLNISSALKSPSKSGLFFTKRSDREAFIFYYTLVRNGK